VGKGKERREYSNTRFTQYQNLQQLEAGQKNYLFDTIQVNSQKISLLFKAVLISGYQKEINGSDNQELKELNAEKLLKELNGLDTKQKELYQSYQNKISGYLSIDKTTPSNNQNIIPTPLPQSIQNQGDVQTDIIIL